MTKLAIGLTRIETEEGTTDYVTCVPPERFAAGLPSEVIVGVLLRPLRDGERIEMANFAANTAFVDLMQGVIAHRGPSTSDLQSRARELHNGTLDVLDQRASHHNEVLPEDVFGEFAVKDGKVVQGSYRPNAKHYIFSSNGFFQLGPELEDCLLQVLAALPGPDDKSGIVS
jgi:hypothetical protein